MTRSIGDRIPTISARNHEGETVELDFVEPTVLYFYPRDDTSGCTTEACQFDAELESYTEAGIHVYGVSTDDVDSHAAFVEKYDLGFDLLADPDGEIAEVFGLSISQTTAPRTTFVLARGEVQRVYEGVDPDGHAGEVLEDLRDSGIIEVER